MEVHIGADVAVKKHAKLLKRRFSKNVAFALRILMLYFASPKVIPLKRLKVCLY